MNKTLKIAYDIIPPTLTLVGTTNWLFVGWLNFDLVKVIAEFFNLPALGVVLYTLVGISGFITLGEVVKKKFKDLI